MTQTTHLAGIKKVVVSEIALYNNSYSILKTCLYYVLGNSNAIDNHISECVRSHSFYNVTLVCFDKVIMYLKLNK